MVLPLAKNERASSGKRASACRKSFAAPFFSFLVVLLFSLPALADPSSASGAGASSLGHMICSIKDNLGAYPHILNAVAYVVGSFMAVRSFLLFKKHGENPAQPQIVPAVAYLIGAGTLMSLPTFAGALQETLFGPISGAGSLSACSPNLDLALSGSGTSASLDKMMQNFVKNIYDPIFSLLSLVAVAIGLTFIVSGLLRGAKTGTNPQASDPKAVISHLLFGAILISIGTVLPSTLESIFGSSDISKMSSITLISWSKIVGSDVDTTAADETVRAVLAFIQIIGGISFVRGWLILKKAVEGGQATIPQGLTHIIGGAMAINIDIMLKALDRTFGTGIIN